MRFLILPTLLISYSFACDGGNLPPSHRTTLAMSNSPSSLPNYILNLRECPEVSEMSCEAGIAFSKLKNRDLNAKSFFAHVYDYCNLGLVDNSSTAIIDYFKRSGIKLLKRIDGKEYSSVSNIICQMLALLRDYKDGKLTCDDAKTVDSWLVEGKNGNLRRIGLENANRAINKSRLNNFSRNRARPNRTKKTRSKEYRLWYTTNFDDEKYCYEKTGKTVCYQVQHTDPVFSSELKLPPIDPSRQHRGVTSQSPGLDLIINNNGVITIIPADSSYKKRNS